MHRKKLVLMGNEAIAYGALEAGVGVVSGYPGTPSSEVIDTLLEMAKSGEIENIYVEWAVNERVAFELCLGAALGGVRSLATMKAPGANVASDPLVASAYSGVEAGMLVLVADDPGPHTTQTEQDSRWYGDLAKLPVIEPSDPQEAHDFTILGFELSERLRLPVILRTTTRVNHTVSDVEVGEPRKTAHNPSLSKKLKKYVRAVMVWNKEVHEELLKTLERAEPLAEELGLNRIEGSGDIGIVCAGPSYHYVLEVLEDHGLLDRYRIMKLGLIHPLPVKALGDFLRSVKKVVVVEEIDPYIEGKLKKLAFELGLDIEILGREEIFKKAGELTPDDVASALLGSSTSTELSLPRRPPPFCPGCPHIGTYMGLRAGVTKAGYRWGEVPVIGDIGCYALGLNPPFEAIWVEHSMGASISIAAGLKLAGYQKPVIAVIGDSTFYHSGITSLIEAIHKNVDVLVVIADNSTVAMTGHQYTPGSGMSTSGRRFRPLDLESVVRGLGVENLSVVNAYNPREVSEKVREYMKLDGVKVIISRGNCAILTRRSGVEQVCVVDHDKCTGCMACVKLTGCPALVPAGEKVKITEAECIGCTLCMQVCPYKAITVVKKDGR